MVNNQIDPITGMAIQPGQIQPNPMINPRVLGGMQPQIPGMFPLKWRWIFHN